MLAPPSLLYSNTGISADGRPTSSAEIQTMWLLKTDTLELEYFVDERATKYCILSHTWGLEEVTYQEIRGESPKWKKGYLKIQQTCRQAIEDGYKHVWIDTCCINKESSAELSEAINSMFNYYAAAGVCYALLEDVVKEAEDLVKSPVRARSRFDTGLSGATTARMMNSRWFARGWTLQELVAPYELQFFDSAWTELGSRRRLAPFLASFTKIDLRVLDSGPLANLNDYSVAARMSWAANRRTTRREDRAYSLMGIFQINMPLLYGEGDKAFQRLQEEIFQRSDDMSILAWTDHNYESRAVFAPSPDNFNDMSQVVCWRSKAPVALRLLNASVEIQAPMIHGVEHMAESWVILNCHSKDDLMGPLALCVMKGFVRETGANSSGFRPFQRYRSSRIKVIPHDIAVRATTQTYHLRPRFAANAPKALRSSPFAHWPPSSRPFCRDIWIDISNRGIYEIECIETSPQEWWSSPGMLRLTYEHQMLLLEGTGGSDSFQAHCTYMVECRPSLGQRLHDGDCCTWKLQVRLQMYLDHSKGIYRLNEVQLVDLGVRSPISSGPRIQAAKRSGSSEPASLHLQPGTKASLQLKPTTKIMGEAVYVISLSIFDEKLCEDQVDDASSDDETPLQLHDRIQQGGLTSQATSSSDSL